MEKKYKSYIGCDEVGRGPLAGPVTACAVKVDLNNDRAFRALMKKLNVTDSKKLSSKKRRTIIHDLDIDILTIECDQVYHMELFSFCLESKSSMKVDELNILQASLLAMRDSVEPLLDNSFVYIDGNHFLPEMSSKKNSNTLPHKCTQAIVQGDSHNELIALSSIIAKELRDIIMKRLSVLYPQFELERHAGYPTKLHKELIAKYGPSPIHRKTFRGVKEYIQGI